MQRAVRSIAGVAVASLLAVAAAVTPLGASASGPETDSAVLTYSVSSGWSCTFTSPDEGTGTCTLVSEDVIFGCLGIAPPVRSASVSLVEPSGESVTISGTATGGGTDGAFAGTGHDGISFVAGGASYTGTCGGVGFLATAQIPLTWTAG